jgi:hypothetical protein
VNSKLTDKAQKSVFRFLSWLDKFGELSQDHQDFYNGKYGAWAKQFYYNHSGIIGKGFVLPMVFCEAFAPSLRSLFWHKSRLPIADAHYAMGFQFMFKITGDKSFLEKSEHFLNELKKSRCPGQKYYSWGYPFNWTTKRGTYPAGTPMITATPYCYEAFRQAYKITENPEWKKIMRSIVNHVLFDLNDVEVSPGVFASSYTPIDTTKIINAISYRAELLYKASVDFANEEYSDIAARNLAFVLKYQNKDGSWPYEIDGPFDFVDNFHTCFVLKHLTNIELISERQDVREAISLGTKYFVANLLDENNLPIPFAKAPRLTVYKRELYNYAELINLAIILNGTITELEGVAEAALEDLFSRWQKKDGSFRSRQLLFGWDNCPMHRWAQSQIFRSLTLYLYTEMGKHPK